jgi:hypothetical protein
MLLKLRVEEDVFNFGGGVDDLDSVKHEFPMQEFKLLRAIDFAEKLSHPLLHLLLEHRRQQFSNLAPLDEHRARLAESYQKRSREEAVACVGEYLDEIGMLAEWGLQPLPVLMELPKPETFVPATQEWSDI